ncbi:MAG: squalene/phytoene synthase family protein, partial [Gammaproteobacteria bacterium]
MPEQTTKKILKNNSKTFYLASLFLSDAVKKNVYTVYAYCRLYDDNVDLNKSDSTQELENKLISLGIEQRVIDQLKSGINSDKEFTRIESISELLRYSYRVAGC